MPFAITPRGKKDLIYIDASSTYLIIFPLPGDVMKKTHRENMLMRIYLI